MSNTNAELQAYLERPLPDLMEELPCTTKQARVSATLGRNRRSGPRRLCDEWNWCEVRQDNRFENDVALGLAVFAALTTRTLNLPINVDMMLISAIVVKRGLDAFCGCL